LPPGKYQYTLKIAGGRVSAKQIEIVADDTWGLMVAPNGTCCRCRCIDPARLPVGGRFARRAPIDPAAHHLFGGLRRDFRIGIFGVRNEALNHAFQGARNRPFTALKER
jgi:hypothetical protein